MSKFCEKCGKQLQDGEICNCSENNDISNNSILNNSITDNNINSNGEVDHNHSLNSDKASNNTGVNNSNGTVNIGDSIKDIVKNIFLKPTEVVANNINDNNFIVGLVLILATSFAKGLQNVLGAYRSYSKISSFSPNYFDKFFRNFGLSLVNYAMIVVGLFVLINIVFKEKTSWKKVVVSVGISLVVTILGNLIYCVLAFSDADIVINIISYISTFIYIFNVYIIYEAIKSITNIDKNKLILSLPLVYVVATIMVDIINKIIS